MVDSKKYLEERWYTFLKKKYDISDDEMDEYIDSFNMINKGNPITPDSLAIFINEATHDHWSLHECRKVILYITEKIDKEPSKIMELKTYLFYVIPICQRIEISRVEIRELFDNIDTNHDNKITCRELTNLIYKINRDLSPSEISEYKKKIKKLCKEMDPKNAGYITYDEFKKFILSNNFDSE